jgi:hypothetical protein
MINDFFDDSKPCPSEIPNCERLREEYKKELSLLNPKACKPCMINGIKSKYINIIANSGR